LTRHPSSAMIARSDGTGDVSLFPEIDHVRTALGSYHQVILNIVLDAWREWSRSAYAARWRTARGRANFIWEEMIANAHQAFDGDARVRLHKTPGSFWLVVDNVLVIRLKKGDNAGFSCNFPTSAALDFHDPQQPLPAINVVQRVEVQYSLDRNQLGIADVNVVCRNGKDIAWSYSILSLASGVSSLPIWPEQTPPTALENLLRPRAEGTTSKAANAAAEEGIKQIE
jgi:hypothetical protein